MSSLDSYIEAICVDPKNTRTANDFWRYFESLPLNEQMGILANRVNFSLLTTVAHQADAIVQFLTRLKSEDRRLSIVDRPILLSQMLHCLETREFAVDILCDLSPIELRGVLTTYNLFHLGQLCQPTHIQKLQSLFASHLSRNDMARLVDLATKEYDDRSNPLARVAFSRIKSLFGQGPEATCNEQLYPCGP